MSSNPSYQELLQHIKFLEQQALDHALLTDNLLDIFNNSLDMIGSGNLEGYFTVINPSFEKILGYSMEEFCAHPFTDFVHEDDLDRTQEALTTAATGTEEIYIENRYRCKNGSIKWIDWKVQVYAEKNQFIAVGRDITDIKETAKQLQELNELNRQIIESAQDGIVVYDRNLQYQVWNPYMEKLSGKKAEEVIGRNPEELFPFLQEKGIFERVKKVLAEGESVPVLDFPFHNPSLNRSGWASDICSPLYNSEGKIAGAIGIVRDITERKKTEIDLERNQEFTQAILSASPNVIYVYDILNKKNIYSNKGISKILGYSSSEIQEMGENFLPALMHPDDFSNYLQNILPRYNKAKNNEAIQHVYRMRDKTGEYHWLQSQESIFARLDDGTPYRIFGIVTDITREKEDKERIRKSEGEYRALFTKMLDGFALHEIICNEKGAPIDYRFLSVNPAFEKLTGLKAKDIIGKTVLEILPGTEKHWIETYGNVALTREPIIFENFSEEIDKHFEVSAYSPFKNQFACIFQDITERKKAEAERVAFEAQLRQSQKMEAIGTLSGGIAHDFNNILAAILGYAEMARDDIPNWSPAKFQIDEVIKAGNRAKDLVKQILTFSRKTEQNRSPVPIDLLIKETLNFLRATIPTSIEIQLNIDPLCGSILADPTQIHQVLMNLCANASQAMEDDGGVLTIDLNHINLQDNVLQGSGLKPGPYELLTIKDTGHGIKQELLEHIFDPYFTTKEIGKGSGMGLAVVHGIVKNHESHISVASTPGQGTTFKLYFPSVETVSTKQSINKGPLPTGNEHILVVDDEPSIANLTAKRLEMLGYETSAMTSSIDTLKAFSSAPNDYDLVITDQTMPQMTGEQLAGMLLEIRADIPIIMCTGYSSKIDSDKAKNIGIRAFIMKPVDNKELAQTIRRILDTS